MDRQPRSQCDDSGVDTLFEFLHSVGIQPDAMGALPLYYGSTMKGLTSRVMFVLKGEPWECVHRPTYRDLGLDPKESLRIFSTVGGYERLARISADVMFKLTITFPGTEYKAMMAGEVRIVYTDEFWRGDFRLSLLTKLTKLIMKTQCRGCGSDTSYSQCQKNPLIVIGNTMILPVCEHCQLETERLAKLVLAQFSPADKGLQKLLWRLIEARF